MNKEAVSSYGVLKVDNLSDELTPLLDFDFSSIGKAPSTAFEVLPSHDKSGEVRERRVVEFIGKKYSPKDFNENKNKLIGEMAAELNKLNKEYKITHILGNWLNGIEIEGSTDYLLVTYYAQNKPPELLFQENPIGFF